MGNAMYISNTSIQALALSAGKNGTVTVLDAASCTLSDQAMINGVITNAAELTQKLKQLAKQHPTLVKNAVLTIDAGSVITKKIPVPQLTRGQYQKLVVEQMNDQTGAYSDLLFDYSFIRKSRDSSFILACAVDLPFLESYLNVFEQAGIRLSGIRIGLENVIAYVRQSAVFANETVALHFVNGVQMLSFIFENGEYVFSSRTRLLGESGQEYAASILQSLSSFIQFNKNITRSFFVGCEEEALQSIRAQWFNTDVSVEDFSLCSNAAKASETGSATYEFLFAQGYGDSGGIDLLNAYQRRNRKPRKSFNKWLLLPTAAVVLVLCVFALLRAGVTGDRKKALQLENELTQTEFTEKMQQAQQLEQALEQFGLYAECFGQAKRVIAGYPPMNTAALDAVYAMAQTDIQVTGISYSAENRLLQVNAATEFQSAIAPYSKRLQAYADFQSVVYSGYQKDPDGRFRFRLEIALEVRS